MAGALVGWSVANYLSDHATHDVLLLTRLTFLGGVVSIYTARDFLVSFPDRNDFGRSSYFRAHSIIGLLLVPVIFSPQFIQSVSVSTVGGSIHTAYLYWLFIAYIIYALLLFPFIVRGQNRKVQSMSQKRQVTIVAWGVILYAIFAAVSNVLLPALVGDWSSSRFGPAFTLFLVGMVAYAIVRHRLFDIRLIVVRSVAYMLTTLVAVLLYGFIA